MERRKVKNGEKSPWDNVLPDQFQTVAAVLASDWCQKNTSFHLHGESRNRVIKKERNKAYLLEKIYRRHLLSLG